jgi:hypothetical protein
MASSEHSWAKVSFKTGVPDGAVTGSISFKMALLVGRRFASTNVCCFRRDVTGTRMFAGWTTAA